MILMYLKIQGTEKNYLRYETLATADQKYVNVSKFSLFDIN